jgi:hypothetical protein
LLDGRRLPGRIVAQPLRRRRRGQVDQHGRGFGKHEVAILQNRDRARRVERQEFGAAMLGAGMEVDGADIERHTGQRRHQAHLVAAR